MTPLVPTSLVCQEEKLHGEGVGGGGIASFLLFSVYKTIQVPFPAHNICRRESNVLLHLEFACVRTLDKDEDVKTR